jgi:hypothetical protein
MRWSIRLFCCVVGFGITTVSFLSEVAYSKPRAKPTVIRERDPWGNPVSDTKYYGVSVSWSFRTVSGGGGGKGNPVGTVTFDSLEAAMRDPRVSAEDKELIQRVYLPKMASLKSELSALQESIKSDLKTPAAKRDAIYRSKLSQILIKYRSMHPSTIEEARVPSL